jgi:hypothetical protein
MFRAFKCCIFGLHSTDGAGFRHIIGLLYSSFILLRIPGMCGSVTNNSTWIRIGYGIYSLWRFTAAHITIIMNTIALIASQIPLTELYCADVSLGGLISSASRH